MLPLAALLLTQAVRTNDADFFIAECAKAVAKIKEGTWKTEVATEERRQVIETIIKGDRSLCRTLVDGKQYVDVAVTPESALYVIYPNRQYFESKAPGPSSKPASDPLPPLEYGSFDYHLQLPHGFVLRANPALSEVKIDRTDNLETLTGSSVKKDGGTLSVKLVRDAKTKLPKALTYRTKDAEVAISFDCKPHKVEDADLVIPPSVFAGFEKIEPPSGNL